MSSSCPTPSTDEHAGARGALIEPGASAPVPSPSAGSGEVGGEAGGGHRHGGLQAKRPWVRGEWGGDRFLLEHYPIPPAYDFEPVTSSDVRPAVRNSHNEPLVSAEAWAVLRGPLNFDFKQRPDAPVLLHPEFVVTPDRHLSLARRCGTWLRWWLYKNAVAEEKGADRCRCQCNCQCCR